MWRRSDGPAGGDVLRQTQSLLPECVNRSPPPHSIGVPCTVCAEAAGAVVRRFPIEDCSPSHTRPNQKCSLVEMESTLCLARECHVRHTSLCNTLGNALVFVLYSRLSPSRRKALQLGVWVGGMSARRPNVMLFAMPSAELGFVRCIHGTPWRPTTHATLGAFCAPVFVRPGSSPRAAM